MKRTHKVNNLILGMALAGAAGMAQAADTGQAYFTGFLGNTTIDEGAFDDSDISFRIGGGFQLNKNIAIEAYYIDYGEQEDWGLTVDGDALQFQGVAMLPVNPGVNIYGKLGLALWDVEYCENYFGGTYCGDDDGNDLVLGFGGSFDMSKQVAIRAEYELAEFDDVDVNTLMVGVNVAF